MWPSLYWDMFPLGDSLVAQLVKSPPAMQETWIWSLRWEDSLEKGKITHSAILTWRIPRTVAQVVKNLSAMREIWVLIPEMGRSPGEGNGSPLQCSCLENPMDRGAWQATIHGIAGVRHDLATKPPCSFYVHFLDNFFFNDNCVLNFIKRFLCIYWDDQIVSFLMWCITLIDLHILKYPCIPGINPTNHVICF